MPFVGRIWLKKTKRLQQLNDLASEPRTLIFYESPRRILTLLGEIKDAMGMMIKAKIRHLPVIEDSSIKGILGLEDLVKYHVGALTQELHYLQDYVTDLQEAAQD